MWANLLKGEIKEAIRCRPQVSGLVKTMAQALQGSWYRPQAPNRSKKVCRESSSAANILNNHTRSHGYSVEIIRSNDTQCLP